MILILLIGLVLTAVAVTLVARVLLVTRLGVAESLGRIGRYGFAGTVELSPSGGLRGFLDDTAGAVGGFVVGRLGLFEETSLRKLLITAGMYRVSPRMLLGYQALLAVCLPALWLWLAIAAHMKAPLTAIGVLIAAAVGWIGPRWVVQNRADMRLNRIDYDMPELIDLLVVTVEAGLGLSAAIQLASERMKGPLAEELRIVLQEQRMGLQLLQAMENMLGRCDTPAMRSFVRAMVQGERLGVSVGQILRSLAVEMRKRRRAKAEEQAQKAPLKILFPLVFLIFPAMFVVILGPAVISIFDAFKK
jgi:tight adherence protein C